MSFDVRISQTGLSPAHFCIIPHFSLNFILPKILKNTDLLCDQN